MKRLVKRLITGLVKTRTAALAGAILAACAAAAVADAGPSRATGYSGSAKTATRAAPAFAASASVVLPFVAAPGASVVVGIARAADAAVLAADYGVTTDARDAALRAIEVEGPQGSLERLSRSVGMDHRIRYVEPLTRYEFAHARNDPATTLLDSQTGIPYEWPFAHVGVDRALNISRGDPNILVGVVDSGWSRIPDLAGKVAKAWYFTSEGSDALDSDGHGTFVASIIAAPDDDGHALAGFCGACRLDVFKNVNLYQFQVAVAIRQLATDGVRIINLSLGGPTLSYSLADALNFAIQKGVLIVASSGNESAGYVDYPAAFLQPPNGQLGYGVAVGASDIDDLHAPFSNWGTHLSMVAPGTLKGSSPCSYGIWAAIPAVATDFDSGHCASTYVDNRTAERYAYASGTSFSAPEVAGVAALVWAARPELKNYQVANILEQSATRPAGTGWTPDRGWGVLNAARAVELATGRSSADSVQFTDVYPEAAARAGRVFTIDTQAAWQDNIPLNEGELSCAVRVGRTSLPGRTEAIKEGSGSCSWRLPAKSGRKRMTGTVSAVDVLGNSAQRSFSYTIKR